MAKLNQDPRNRNGRQQKSGTLKKSQSTNVILKIKSAKSNEHKIKATFTDGSGQEVKELIYMYKDGDPKELLLQLEMQVLKLGDQ